jgi:hypothetical protein
MSNNSLNVYIDSVHWEGKNCMPRAFPYKRYLLLRTHGDISCASVYLPSHNITTYKILSLLLYNMNARYHLPFIFIDFCREIIKDPGTDY